MLIAECEPADARETRRDSVGCSAGETYAAVLRRIVPDAAVMRVMPADRGAAVPDGAALADFDAVVLTGSPLHLYHDSPECQRTVEFMVAVFAAGTPAFGSCAGLQIATVAAGGSVRPMGARREAGFARRITATDAGRGHPLLDGRAAAFDAPAIHTDEVATLPPGGAVLATNVVTTVQAAEIVHAGGTFWGVQYHPEINLFEVAAALRRQADDLVEHGLAEDTVAIAQHAGRIEALHAAPERRDLAWQLGLNTDVTDPDARSIEIRNFFDRLVRPIRARRGRG